VKIRLLTVMKFVAIIAISLGATVHVVRLFRAEDDFATGFLIVEGIGLGLLAGIALGVGYFVKLVRADHRYARDLRRSDGATPLRWLGDEGKATGSSEASS
jgi:hypothetical protein